MSLITTADRLEAIRSRYRKSEEMVRRAEQVIPLASQTFSKSHIQYPANASPLFLERGSGAHVWDVDGNEYVDFVSGLLPVILGYDDPEVNEAVQRQLAKGVSFSLPTVQEVELAEKLVEIIPCAEKVRYGKNGSDATSAAIRLARAFTGRDRVAVCGYHGWHDWYIASTTRDKGIPKAVKALTHKFVFNDLSSLENVLEQHPEEFAAVIMEPMNVDFPNEGFLQGVKELTHRHGALFVLDEIITGFRFGLGGAQKLFGVTPDLACFGKSMGNGYPISAVVGRADVMDEMKEIFYSGTFGGEAISLAASIATIEKLERENVIADLAAKGEHILRFTNENIVRHGLQDMVRISGHPSWTLLSFKDGHGATLWETKSLYLQEILLRGVLSLGTHNLSYSHSMEDLEHLRQVQDEAFGVVREALEEGNLASFLAGSPMAPLFRVR